MDSVRISRVDSRIQSPPSDKTMALTGQLQVAMHDVEQLFWVDRDKLKHITQRFGEELEEGLQDEGKNIPMNMTWVLGFPSGHQQGSFLTLDLGGTNLRVCWITLPGGHGVPTTIQHRYTLPEALKLGTADELWDAIADRMALFIHDEKLIATPDNPLHLGFTFSYPATQDSIDHGILQRWTKGWDVQGVEGHDVSDQLRKAIEKKALPIKLVALINDTTGTMIASAYRDPHTIIGAIFGTGSNAAYMENSDNIPKLKGRVPPNTLVAINCEYGAFDNSHRVLPLTPYDKHIDATSPRPGQQAFEKTNAGLYLGELFRLVLIDLHSKNLIFQNKDITALKEPYSIDSAVLSDIDDDASQNLTPTGEIMQKLTGIGLTDQERTVCRRLAEYITVRGARLCACGIAAICKRKNMSTGHVAADGAVVIKGAMFKHRWAAAMAEILDWRDDRDHDPITLTPAEDGSGLGAAVIAAMTMDRAHKGETSGIKSVDI